MESIEKNIVSSMDSIAILYFSSVVNMVSGVLRSHVAPSSHSGGRRQLWESASWVVLCLVDLLVGRETSNSTWWHHNRSRRKCWRAPCLPSFLSNTGKRLKQGQSHLFDKLDCRPLLRGLRGCNFVEWQPSRRMVRTAQRCPHKDRIEYSITRENMP